MNWLVVMTVPLLAALMIEPTHHSIVDTVPPRVIGCPEDIHKTAPLGSRTPVFWTQPRAVDDSGVIASTSLNFSPGTAFPIARLPVIYTFRDGAGNEATCRFWIIITEEEHFNCTKQTIHLDHPSTSPSPSPQTITSPKYPMEYPSNFKCQWEVWKSISNDSSTNGIVLKIREIQLHPTDTLVVTAMDGNERVIYSGRVPPRMLLFQGAGLSISLQAGNGGSAASMKGFLMEAEEVEIKGGHSSCDHQCRASTICIAERYRCDRVIDCPLGDDEHDCSLCQENITSLPFQVTFDPNNVTHSNHHPFNQSYEYLEWCFTASVGYRIDVDFPPPGNVYLVIQSPFDEFGQDMVALTRQPSTHSLSHNGTALVVRLYAGFQGIGTGFSITVRENQKAYCDTGYQCTDSHFCVERKNDCDGTTDCPLGDDEISCGRRCPESCLCKTSPGSLNISSCKVTWNPQLSRSVPAITTKLEIALENFGRIESGFFEGLTNLNYLLVTSSNITKLEPGALRGMENLQYLKLRNNSLTSLASDTFKDVPNLVELELRRNKLVELEPSIFQEQTKLEKLFLQYNQLMNLPSHLFSSLHHLQYLYIHDNNLARLPGDVFEGLAKLKYLRLMSNKLNHFPPGLFQELLNLERIDISNNSITELAGETLHGLVKLKKISLQNNNLTHFKDGFFSNFTHLEGIYSRNNSIRDIQPSLFHGLVNLTCIDLKNNQLQDVPHDALQGLTRLTQLYLSGNQLSSLDPRLLKGHTLLDKLELQRNHLTTLQPGHFRDLGKLKSLYLSNNELTKLRSGTFDGLGSVTDLLLDSNDIKEVEPGTFKGLTMLGTLDLRFNQITELKKGIFDGMFNLRNLYLSGNPLQVIDARVFDVLPHLHLVMTDNHGLCCFLDSSIDCDVSAQPEPPYFSCGRRLLTQDIMKAFIWMQVIFAISGNLVVLLWRGRQIKGHRKKSQTLLILNLAASDLLMGLYLFIIASADLHFGEDFLMQMVPWRASLTCKFAGIIGLVSSEASVFLVTLISIDRFLGVVFPFSRLRMSTRATVKALVVLWMLALGLSIAASALSATNNNFYELSNVCLGLPLSTKPTNITTTRMMSESTVGRVMVEKVDASGNKPAWLFPIVLFLGVNLLSFLIIFVCYLAIFISARISSNKSTRPADKAEEMRLAIKMGLIVGTDFCCWVPVIIMGILSQSGVVEIEQTMYAWAVIFILPINSSINPWLYTLSVMLPAYWKNRGQRKDSSISTGSSSAGIRAKLAGYSRGKEKRSSTAAMSSLGTGVDNKLQE